MGRRYNDATPTSAAYLQEQLLKEARERGEIETFSVPTTRKRAFVHYLARKTFKPIVPIALIQASLAEVPIKVLREPTWDVVAAVRPEDVLVTTKEDLRSQAKQFKLIIKERALEDRDGLFAKMLRPSKVTIRGIAIR